MVEVVCVTIWMFVFTSVYDCAMNVWERRMRQHNSFYSTSTPWRGLVLFATCNKCIIIKYLCSLHTFVHLIVVVCPYRIPCIYLSRHDRYVALKIVKSAKHYSETAVDEIDLLKRVSMGCICYALEEGYGLVLLNI